MNLLHKSMRFLCIALLPVILITAVACDDDPDPNSRDSVLAGETEEALYYSALQEPDTTLNDNIHTTTREVELDGQPGADLLIISEMDTIFDAMDRPIRATKQLSIRSADDADPILIAINGDTPRIYGRAQEITRNNTAWLLVSDAKIVLASSDQDLTSGQSVIEGDWNGAIKQFMGVLMPRGSNELLSWIELTVINFDNYVFINNAAYILD